MSPQLEFEPIHILRQAILAKQDDVRMLVPTATLAEHRRHQLAREGLIFRPERIQTFSRFATDLAIGVEQVSEPLLHLIVEEELRRIAPGEFSPVSDAPGFPASLAGAMGRLDAAGLTPRDLARVCGDWPYAGPFARIWNAVLERFRARRFTLRAGLLRAAAHAAKPTGTLLLEGFAKFSGPEQDLLRSLGVETRPRPQKKSATERDHFAADSDVREAEEIARRILVSGVPFREIGIALRNPERTVPVLRPVLERFGIPARFYFSEPLKSSAVARFFVGTVNAFLSGWEHELCLSVLRLAPGFPPEEMDRFEFAVQEQIPNSGLAALRELRPERRVGRVLANWETLQWNWQRRLTPSRWAEALGLDLRSLYRPQAVADGHEWGTGEWERNRAAAVPLLEAALVETALAWPEGAAPVSLAEFWAAAATVIEHTALRVKDNRRNVVHVMSVYEARQWDLDTVFVCGLAEKLFPRRHAQDAFLPDAAMEKLKLAGFAVETAVDRDHEEEEVFRMVLNSARRAVLSYAADGKNGLSAFWGQLDEAGEEPPAVMPAARERTPARASVPRIGDPQLAEWMIKERHSSFSVTGLESHLACPFKFFAGQTLKLKQRPERPEKRLTFLEEGSIVHRVLEEWLPERPPISAVLDRVFEQRCQEKRIVRGYRTEAAYARMLADLERFAGASTEWPKLQACAVEKQLQFEVADGVLVKARIDRIERLDNGQLVIIDYKYSSAANTKGNVNDETRLQGPLYVRGMEAGGESVAAMVYFSLKKKPEPFGWGVVPGLSKQLEPLTPEWIAKGTAEARRAVSAIRAGDVAVRPESKDACKWCDAVDVCRVETAATMAVGSF